MSGNPLRVLHVSSADVRGGAEQVARNLVASIRARGVRTWLAVGQKLFDDPDTLLIPNDAGRSLWARSWSAVADSAAGTAGPAMLPAAAMVRSCLRAVGQPKRALDLFRGHEDFDFPGTRRLIDLAPERPDIVHCHALHGDYFDLNVLPELSHQVPTVLTLQDAWTLSGHCAHSFDCDRWLIGCGRCPHLETYPAVRRDGTAANWRRKQHIFARSRMFVAAPCRWLMDRAHRSMMAPGIADSRVVPNGVNRALFRPADRRAVRTGLGISEDAKVLLFSVIRSKGNIFKDYRTIERAIALVAARLPRERILFLNLGGQLPAQKINQAEVRFVPFQKDIADIVPYYQAADIYVHAAKMDTFPNVVLEALCCGTPVVATAVGGIPEQIRHLASGAGCAYESHGPDRATGILVPPEDPDAMAEMIARLLADDRLRRQLGENAAEDARARFDVETQATAYLKWYEEILARERAERPRRDARHDVGSASRSLARAE